MTSNIASTLSVSNPNLLSNSPPVLPTNMADKEVDQVVLGYLKKRGFRNAEAAFRQESRVQPVEDLALHTELEDNVSVANYIMFYNPAENTPEKFNDSYTSLREWIYNSSLDIYRPELLTLLYPLFVHCYLDLISRNQYNVATQFMAINSKDHKELHADEILELESLTSAEHLAKNPIAITWRNNRFNVTLSRFSFELVVSFLQEKKFMILLSILNQYVNIKVFSGQPNAFPTEEYHAITGKTNREIATINRREVYWGLFDEQIPKNKDQTPEEPEKKEEEKEEEDDEDRKAKKAKKEEKKPKSPVPLPKMTEQAELEYREDLSKRVSLGPTSLPSICFSTLFHTQGMLNTVELARDGSYVVGGFADSTVKVWDLKNTGSKQNLNAQRKEDYTNFIGHAGPVYGACFSPDRQFLFTCSEDKTARIWSMDTKTNLASYRSHNYPIWDIDVSPLGYYFATASHDRTARLWTTDHIFPIRIFAGHLSDVNCVKFHPNCNYVATGSSDKSLRLWEVNTGAPVRIFTGHYGSITTLAISPDGKMLASASDDNKIMLWDLGTSKKIATFVGHRKSIWSLDFSAESSLLASGSSDDTVRIWDCTGQGSAMAMEESSLQSPVDGEVKPATPKPETSPELLKTFPTKSTAVYKVKFTRRNLLLAAGPFTPTESNENA